MDGYIRVSRVGGRAGERYISPRLQREKIEGWARLHDVALGEIVVEEDVSGAKPVAQRELGRLLERIESGLSRGLVTMNLKRFGRDTLETLQATKRIKEAGGRLVTVEDGVDSSQASGKLVITMLAALAEQELDARREAWRAARGSAVKRGVHVAPTPIGYLRRTSDGRLEVDPETAPLISVAFRLRAESKSWGQIAAFLTENGVLPRERKGRKSVAWSRQGVSSVIRNPVYKGQARSGEFVMPNAHEPIVSEEEWQAAQRGGKSLGHVRDGSIAGQGLLAGIAHCAGCGHKLSLTGSTTRNGARVANYYCRTHYASGKCGSPAVASTRTLDPYVEQQLLEALRSDDPRLVKPAAIGKRIKATEEVVEAAHAELEAFLQAGVASLLGPETYRAEVEKRQEAIREAEAAWAEAMDANLAIAVKGASVRTAQEILADWPSLTVPERRAVVRVARADPKRRRWQPIGERTEVVWSE
jgi:site-specific DNA recombinase